MEGNFADLLHMAIRTLCKKGHASIAGHAAARGCWTLFGLDLGDEAWDAPYSSTRGGFHGVLSYTRRLNFIVDEHSVSPVIPCFVGLVGQTTDWTHHVSFTHSQLLLLQKRERWIEGWPSHCPQMGQKPLQCMHVHQSHAKEINDCWNGVCP